jgi:hypothetical protein
MFMGHPTLKLDTTKLGDLLDEKYYEITLMSHIDYRHECMKIRLKNALDINATEWIITLQQRPKIDFEGLYESNFTNDIMSMLSQEVCSAFQFNSIFKLKYFSLSS